ncbi:MAG: FkbM family methyltransferase [Nitrososphaerales archaeon]
MRAQDVIAEVGALFGGGTQIIAGIARVVYSFEPVKHNFAALRENTRNYMNVRPARLAIGNMSGRFNINIYKLQGKVSTGASSLRDATEYWGELTPDSTQKVEVVSLDSLKLDPRPTVLICDCEGSEVEVLEGARETIKNLRLIMIEMHKTESQLRTFFETLPGLFLTTYGIEYPKWFVATRNGL